MSPSATSSAAPFENGLAQRAHAPAPQRVSDEFAWELVRDEWELLLSIGSGPTSASQAAQALNLAPAQIDKRVRRLLDKNLIRSSANGDGFELVPAFYERREGMSSYLRDLVLRRLTDERVTAAPLSARSRRQLGDKAALTALIAQAERTLFPEVVALANRPESERSERFSVFFAFSDMEHAPKRPARTATSQADGFRGELLDVLQAAATARSLDPNTRSSYLWVAEMRTDPEVAQEIGDLLERFVDTLEAPTATGGEAGDGALAFAVLPNQTSRPASPSGPTPKVGIP
ncbi:MAG TPA: hypothetical protein PK095_13860 [Myxococcota bacterium]|nr:hypothetical protein [Myxococcota bacterium]